MSHRCLLPFPFSFPPLPWLRSVPLQARHRRVILTPCPSAEANTVWQPLAASGSREAPSKHRGDQVFPGRCLASLPRHLAFGVPVTERANPWTLLGRSRHGHATPWLEKVQSDGFSCSHTQRRPGDPEHWFKDLIRCSVKTGELVFEDLICYFLPKIFPLCFDYLVSMITHEKF